MSARQSVTSLFYTFAWVGLSCSIVTAQDELSELRASLQQARKVYEEEANSIRQDILELSNNRLDLVRKQGNQQAVDVVLSEQKGLKEYFDLPPDTPMGQQRKLGTLTKTLDKAYSDAIRNLTKLKQFEEAQNVEKEQEEFRYKASIRTTRTTLLGTWDLRLPNYQTKLTFFPDGTMFHSTEGFTGVWRVDHENRQILVSKTELSGADRIVLPLNPKGGTGKSSSGGMFKIIKIANR